MILHALPMGDWMPSAIAHKSHQSKFRIDVSDTAYGKVMFFLQLCARNDLGLIA